MNVSEALRARHSVRAFRPDPVAEDVLREIFSDAQRAPAWCNIQPWRVAVTSGAATAKLTSALTLTIGSKANTFDGSADVAWTLAEIGAASTTALTTEATTRATNDNAIWAALYAEQTGGTECIIPLAATGDGSGVLTLRLWSDVANTAKSSAGAFYCGI